MNNLSDFQKGWICGIIAGEGSLTGDKNRPTITIKMHSRDHILLKQIQDTIGGKLYGRYLHGGRDYYMLVFAGRELDNIVALLRESLPDSYKREQLSEWLTKWGYN